MLRSKQDFGFLFILLWFVLLFWGLFSLIWCRDLLDFAGTWLRAQDLWIQRGIKSLNNPPKDTQRTWRESHLHPVWIYLKLSHFKKTPKSQNSQKSQSRLLFLKGWRSKISNLFRFLWIEGLLKKTFYLVLGYSQLRASLVIQTVENLPAIWETWVRSLGWEDPLEEDMATHSSILALRIPIDKGTWWATVHR